MGTITATDWMPSCESAAPCGPPVTDGPEVLATTFGWLYYPALVLPRSVARSPVQRTQSHRRIRLGPISF